MPAPPGLVANKVVSLFQPLRPFGRTTRTFEELPLERFAVGAQRLTGWSFAGGAVPVIRTQGHCRGHVVVFFRDAELLHLGDESNGGCGVMQDSDQLNLQTILSTNAAMVGGGTVQRLTDGHTFEVFDRAGARALLELLLDQAMGLQQIALDVVGEQGSVSPEEFVTGYTAGLN